jgi:hypothetical protein
MYTASRGAGERSASAAARRRAPQHGSRRSSSASALVALAALLLALGARASRSGASCAGHAECPLGEHCDGSGRCRSCSAITPSRCDVVDAECCSAAFRAQCPSNPGGCLSADLDASCVNVTSTCNVSNTVGHWPPDHSRLSGCRSDWRTGSGIACGEQCTATCDVGWKGGRSSETFQCIGDTSAPDRVRFNGSLACIQQTCSLPVPVPLHWTGDCTASLGFGEHCTARCEEGWTAGKAEETFGCISDSNGGVKPSGSLTCRRQSCALPSENLLHSTGNCSATLGFGERCTATCEEGWTAGKTKETFGCISDDSNGGVKLSGSLTCKRKRLSPAASPGLALESAAVLGIASRACLFLTHLASRAFEQRSSATALPLASPARSLCSGS